MLERPADDADDGCYRHGYQWEESACPILDEDPLPPSDSSNSLTYTYTRSAISLNLYAPSPIRILPLHEDASPRPAHRSPPSSETPSSLLNEVFSVPRTDCASPDYASPPAKEDVSPAGLDPAEEIDDVALAAKYAALFPGGPLDFQATLPELQPRRREYRMPLDHKLPLAVSVNNLVSPYNVALPQEKAPPLGQAPQRVSGTVALTIAASEIVTAPPSAASSLGLTFAAPSGPSSPPAHASLPREANSKSALATTSSAALPTSLAAGSPPQTTPDLPPRHTPSPPAPDPPPRSTPHTSALTTPIVEEPPATATPSTSQTTPDTIALATPNGNPPADEKPAPNLACGSSYLRSAPSPAMASVAATQNLSIPSLSIHTSIPIAQHENLHYACQSSYALPRRSSRRMYPARPHPQAHLLQACVPVTLGGQPSSPSDVNGA